MSENRVPKKVPWFINLSPCFLLLWRFHEYIYSIHHLQTHPFIIHTVTYIYIYIMQYISSIIYWDSVYVLQVSDAYCFQQWQLHPPVAARHPPVAAQQCLQPAEQWQARASVFAMRPEGGAMVTSKIPGKWILIPPKIWYSHFGVLGY